jgi:hypothetical protein
MGIAYRALRKKASLFWAHFRGFQTLAGLAPETGLSATIPHKPHERFAPGFPLQSLALLKNGIHAVFQL